MAKGRLADTLNGNDGTHQNNWNPSKKTDAKGVKTTKKKMKIIERKTARAMKKQPNKKHLSTSSYYSPSKSAPKSHPQR